MDRMFRSLFMVWLCDFYASGPACGMEYYSCYRCLLNRFSVLFCFCQSRMTHMLHAGLWPGPLEWFTALSILSTFSIRHKSASCWFCFVGFLLPLLLAWHFWTSQQWLFIYSTNGRRQEMQTWSPCCILCVWTCCIILSCVSVLLHTPCSRNTH